MSARSVPIDHEQALLLEEIGIALMRNGDNLRGTQVLAIVLAWRHSRTIEDLLEEDGALAPVVDLQDWSKRVGA